MKIPKYIIPVCFIIVIIFFACFFRSYTFDLPMTDGWAKNSVENYYKGLIGQEIYKQFPNLPQDTLIQKVNDEYNAYYIANKATIDSQVNDYSKQIKSEFQYIYGGKTYTYMPDIDTYLWYGVAKNYIKTGTLGSEIRNGIVVSGLRNGRLGIENPTFNIYPMVIVWLYSFLNIFMNIPLMFAEFIMPLIIISLTSILIFFVGRKLGGNVCGFFAGSFVALNFALMARTPAGGADTDMFNVFFPALFLFFLVYTFESTIRWHKIVFSVLTGVSLFLYSLVWIGWWYPFNFLLAGSAIYIVYDFIKNKKITEEIKNMLLIVGITFVTALILISSTVGFQTFADFFNGPFKVVNLKVLVENSIWPNVMTTVAEFNTIPAIDIITQMGGWLFFSIALIGLIIFQIERKWDIKYSILFFIWFVLVTYGFTKGIRFSILMVPMFAVVFGLGVYYIFKYSVILFRDHLGFYNTAIKYFLFGIICLLLIPQIMTAHNLMMNQFPMMNDGWVESFDAIKKDNPNGIITSWWDFGHFFTGMGDLKVTFDGADQGYRIYWVGKLLLTPDEDESVDILKMLNCYQESLRETNELICNGDQLCGYEKTVRELPQTKCDFLPQYVIASEDMVGKAGVWGHFGSWNFTKANIYNTYAGKDWDGNISESDYYEIQNTPADQWVAGWPSYIGSGQCINQSNITKCQASIGNNLLTLEMKENYDILINGKQHPYSIVYFDGTKVVEKKFEDGIQDFSVIYLEDRIVLAQPLQANSMFTKLFYFEGKGLEHFTKIYDTRQVTGERIITYRVNLE